MARDQRRIRHRGDALFAQRQDRRSGDRPRRRGGAVRSDRALDLPSRAGRSVAALGDPADLTASFRLNANGRAASPAILFGLRRHCERSEAISIQGRFFRNSKCSGSSKARIVVVRTLPFELTLSTYLATASSSGASMIWTKS